MIKDKISRKKSIIIESTISGSGHLGYAKIAKEQGYRTTLIYICLKSAEMSAQRVAKRVSHGGHNIPLNDIKRRHPRSMGNLKPYIREFESAHIYDNSEGYQWVAAYRNGIIHHSSKHIPSWLSDYLK